MTAVRAALPALAVVLLAVLAVGALAYRQTYGNLPVQGPPLNLMCGGREYRREPDDRAVSFRALAVERVEDVRRAPPVVGWRVVLDAARSRHDGRRFCGEGIYVRRGGDRLLAYSLQGGL